MMIRVRRVRAIAVCASLALLAAGAGAAEPFRIHDGGTLNIVTPQPLYTEPAASWASQASGSIASATGLRLMYLPDVARPDLRPVPEAAAKVTVSRDRRTYTFRIKKGLKFSDGSALGPVNFAWAIYRNVFFKSYGGYVVRDIAGSKPFADRKTKVLSGVKYNAASLTIKLVKPSGDLMARLALPMFSALPLKLPARPPYPSAGPYYVASDQPSHVVLKVNPFYVGQRPHHVDIFNIVQNTNEAQNIAQVQGGQADFLLAGLSEASAEALAPTYGVNGSSQLQIHASLAADYVALNTSRGPFANAQLRKAANYAIDRPAMLRVRGAFAGTRTDQILPPGVPGFRDAKVYPLDGPDYAKAKQLAGNSCGAVTLYTYNTPIGQGLAHEFSFNLSQMGCNVNVKSFPLAELEKRTATKGEPFDAALAGWTQDYPDPYDFLDILLNGNNIHADNNNNNLSYFNNAKVNKLLEQANRRIGPSRYKAYGNLDILITQNYAPWAAYDNRNEREFVSRRVGGYLFQPANASADLNTLFLK